MSKYYGTTNKRQPPRPQGPHPIWRGMGCILILVIPIISYGSAAALIDMAVTNNWPIPYQLVGHPAIHPLLLKITSLIPLWNFIYSINNLYAILALTLLFIVIMESIISVIYSLMFRASVPRYGPLDEPPPDIKVKRYTR